MGMMGMMGMMGWVERMRILFHPFSFWVIFHQVLLLVFPLFVLDEDDEIFSASFWLPVFFFSVGSFFFFFCLLTSC